jgi:anti-anti-sigma factor
VPDDYFSITRAPGAPGTICLLFTGDLDMGARDRIQDAVLTAAGDATAKRIVADMRGVRFIDSEAVSALLDGYVAAEEGEIEFQIAGALGIVRRVFEVIGLEHLLTETP